MPIGEVGTLTRGGFGDGEIIRIDFTEPLTDPVIHLSSTNRGGNEFSLRVVSVDADGFEFILEEWEDEDGPHPATETINWIAVEEGTHVLPDGRIIEAGTTTATTTASNVALDPAHTGTPVVLTNVMSANDPHVVDSDPFNVSSTGFDVQLQEGSLADGVNNGETVGFIAISTGGDGQAGYASLHDPLTTGYSNFDLGGSLTDGAVFGETQSMNDTSAGNVVLNNNAASTTGNTGTVRAKFDEETGDGNSGHANETVGLVGFELGAIPCFTPEDVIATPFGERFVSELVTGDRVITLDHGIKPVLANLSVTLDKNALCDDPALRPILIRKNALAPNIPAQDLRVSPQHRMLIKGWRAELMFGTNEVLVPAKSLVNDTTIVRDHAATQVTYIHLVFDDHEILFSNGAPSESLHAGYIAKETMPPAAREELFRLFPELRSAPTAWGPTARKALTVGEGKLLA